MTNPDPDQQKRDLRRRMRALPAPSPEISAAIRARLARWLGARPALRTVAAFAPLPDEPNLLPLLDDLPGRRWVLPRVVGDDIVFHEVRRAEDLSPGAFGIPEPAPASPVVAPEEIDVFLCPGLAFDPAGRRLGRGKGYYDRLLSAARPEAALVGIVPAKRIVSNVPALPHDIRMHWLAGEKEVGETAPGSA